MLFSIILLNIKQRENNIINNIILFFTASILFSLLLSFLFYLAIIKKIKLLKESFNLVATKNFETKILQKENDPIEFLDLIESFNKMTTALHSIFSELNFSNNELNNIILSLKEAIVIINEDDKIIRCNTPFLNMFNVSNAYNRYFWEIIRNNKIVKDINKINKKKDMITEEIEFDKKFFLYSISKINERNFIIVIFHDITEIKKVESLKKDFVSNVSHELMTPLTAIKGFIETLLEQTVEKKAAMEYLYIIKRNSDRMINIVKDLLLLSELESNSSNALNIEKVKICTLLKNIVPVFMQKLKEKNLKLELKQSEDKEIIIEGDNFKLEQVFINLIDNAIKYSDKGTIKVIIKKIDGYVQVEVKDQGIGISEKDIDRIFERFYVVNKSRSRSSGGTGLGLAIVKHIVLLHKGEIKVESKAGKGSCFIVTIPLTQN